MKKLAVTLAAWGISGMLGLLAQPYGLDQPQAIGPYLNGVFPPTAPSSSASWNVEIAFTNATFDQPMFLLPYPGTNRLVILYKPGRISTFPNRRDVQQSEILPFLDISARTFTVSDSGLTGMAFHPQFGQPGSTNRGFVYVTYKWRPPGATGNADYAFWRLSRFTVPDGQMAADSNSEVVMVQTFDQQMWHDAGCLMFGADGFLYFSVGDDGGANDEYNATQKINERLMSGIFRIDVNQNSTLSHPIRRQPFHHPAMPAGWPESFTTNYFVPNDNPFVNPDGSVLEEYYALGFRQPYRFSRDPVTGLIWVADSGQSTREEIDILVPGANYGWAYREGTFAGPKSPPGNLIGFEKGPLHDYGRDQGGAAIGGYVYRGVEHAGFLTGKYIWVDNVSGRIWAITSDGTTLTNVEYLTSMPSGSVYGGTSSCGLDANGEIYFLKFGGTGAQRIFKLARTTTIVAEPPALLSQVGAFTNLVTLAPAPGLITYDVNTPLWSDAAEKYRWLAVPNDGTHNTVAEQITFSPTNEWQFPAGTVFVKHFELAASETNAAPVHRLETRFLVRDQNGGVYGVTYKWRADGSDADLLLGGASQDYSITTATGIRTQHWTFPSRLDCATCHNANAKGVLGLKTHQMNGGHFYPQTGRTDNQLRTLGHLGMFSSDYNEAQLGSYLKSFAITNTSQPLVTRVRSYIDANCSHCHRPGGQRANFDARYTIPLEQQNLIYGAVFDAVNGPEDRVVRPQDLPHSMLHNRANRVGALQMPPLAKNMIDTNAMQLFADWIMSLPTGPGVTLTRTNTSSLVVGPFFVNVEFTAPVTGLTTDDFQLSNGSVTALSGSGGTYTITVTPVAFGAVTVKLPAGQVQDGTAQGNYESNTLTVNYSNVPPGLVHRWSFNDGTDSVGNITASLTGSASFAGGKLVLPGGGTFANYAAANISNTLALHPTISVETWFRMASVGTWSKVWMFGRDTTGQPTLSYINFTPNTGGGYPKLDFDTASANELNTTAAPNPAAMQANTDYHVVAVFDFGTDTMSLYINGTLADSASMGGGDIIQLNANLARFGAGFFYGDPDLSGSIDELRIWSVALPSSTISNSFVSGPDTLPTPGYLPPTLSVLGNQATTPGVATPPQPFTITPGSVALGSLNVSASSSNPTLVPNANVAVSGSGSNRTVSVLPVAGQRGATTITVSVNDGTLLANEDFVVAVTANPVAHYRFDGNAQDSSGNGNHGTANGGVGYAAGQVGSQALTLNGVDAYVQIPVSVRSNFTISFWAKTTDTGATGAWLNGKGFVDGDVPGATTDFGTTLLGAKLGFGVGNPNTTISSTTSVNDGQWHLLTVTRASASGAMNVYVNGVLEATTTGPTGLRAAPTALRIGAVASGGATKFLNGSMDDVRLYDYVLAGGEIAALAEVTSVPNITQQPAGQSLALGAAATLSVVAGGSAPLTYQWRKDGGNISGANFASLAIVDAQFSDAGNYTVVVANGGGSVTSAVAAVTVYNPTPVSGLLHRWSFNDGADTVGGANATLVGAANYSGGQLVLPGGGTFMNYASVNIGNTLSNHANLTVETWFTLNQLSDWSKVWMFGRDTAPPALSYINFTPRTGVGGNPPKIDFDTASAGELNTLGATDPAALTAGTQYHVVSVFDAANNTMSFYLNGNLTDSASMGGGNITDLQANLARFGTGFFYLDPDLNGAINELRIWQGALSGSQISNNFAAGPDVVAVAVPRPLISDYELVPGTGFQIGGAGVVGQTYILQGTTNLVAPIRWTSIATNTVGGSGVFQFLDTQITNRPHRFYRVMTE